MGINIGRPSTKVNSFGLTSLIARCLLLLAVSATGCSSYSLTVSQADYINTEGHLSRPPSKRTGNPLEVNVVCVYPKDLEKPQNQQLHPDRGITSNIWYKYRPREAVGAAGGDKFDLPADQILLFTDDDDIYGTRVGPTLRGAVVDGKRERTISDLNLKDVNDRRTVVYVFALFRDGDGHVLKAPPAVFQRPRQYPKELTVEIGVEDRVNRTGQYIRNTTSK